MKKIINEDYIKYKNEMLMILFHELMVPNFNLKPLFKNQEHINLIKDAMFSSSNEPWNFLQA